MNNSNGKKKSKSKRIHKVLLLSLLALLIPIQIGVILFIVKERYESYFYEPEVNEKLMNSPISSLFSEKSLDLSESKSFSSEMPEISDEIEIDLYDGYINSIISDDSKVQLVVSNLEDGNKEFIMPINETTFFCNPNCNNDLSSLQVGDYIYYRAAFKKENQAVALVHAVYLSPTSNNSADSANSNEENLNIEDLFNEFEKAE